MDPPKLLHKKPKKSQRKPVQHPPPPPSSSSSASIATSSTPPPAQPPKESFARRYKFLWPLVLGCNVIIGAYLFMRTKKKDVGADEEVEDVSASSVSTSSLPTTVVNAAVTEKPLLTLPIVEPIKPCEPIPEGQQRELFKWILEEKRKIKPRDAEEKKRIDEEKAILKHFIRSTSIPTL